MRISFDIDNTLVPYSDEFPIEDCNSILRLLSREKLRAGTTQLFKSLENNNHEIWIYTTSFRPVWRIKLLFAKYGLYPKGYINQSINLKHQKRYNSQLSKNPKLFDIDLHIDDSEGVALEGEKAGFDTIVVCPSDTDWTNKILNSVKIKELNLDSQFQNLIITLIALSSSPKKQKEIYGFGDTTAEMLEDFFTYFYYQKENWLELQYLTEGQVYKLHEVLQIIQRICDDEDNDFWTNQTNSEEARSIKILANDVIVSLGKENVIIEVSHKNKYDKNGNFLSQSTTTILKDRNQLNHF